VPLPGRLQYLYLRVPDAVASTSASVVTSTDTEDSWLCINDGDVKRVSAQTVREATSAGAVLIVGSQLQDCLRTPQPECSCYD